MQKLRQTEPPKHYWIPEARPPHGLLLLCGLCLAVFFGSISHAQQAHGEGDEPQLNVNWLYGAFVPKEAVLKPLNGPQRLRLFTAQSFTTPGIYIKTVFFATIDQAHGTPPEWGGGIPGYGRRLGSRYGQYLIQNSLSTTGNALLGYEPRYDRCHCTGFWPRTRHAFLRNFVTYNQTESERRPQLALYAGAFGSGAIASLWYPGNPKSWVEGYKAMATQGVWGLATNWVGEFAPEIDRVLKRKKN
jgi:hypothetical protein